MRKNSGKKGAVNFIRKGIAGVLAVLLLVCGTATPKVHAATEEPALQEMAESGYLEEQVQVLEMWRNFILDLPEGENGTRLTYRFWWGNLDEDDDREMIVSVGEINLNMGMMQEMLHVYDLKKEDGEFTPVKLFEELPPVQIRFGFSASKEGDMLYSYVSALATGTFSEGTVKLNEEKSALVYTETAQRSMAKEETSSLDAVDIQGSFDPEDRESTEWGVLEREIFADRAFILGRNNNGFSHRFDGELSGLAGLTRYEVSREQYLDLVVGELPGPFGAIQDINTRLSSNMSGVCFGLSSLIGLVVNGSMSVSDLDSEADFFYDMKKPNENPVLFHEICYLFLKQYLLDGGDYEFLESVDISKNTEEEFAEKLQKFVESIRPEQQQMLSYIYDKGYDGDDEDTKNDTGGHAVLIKSLKHYPSLGIYDFTIYDQNSVMDTLPKGEYFHMYIKDDFSDLIIMREDNVSPITKENCLELQLVDVNTVLEEGSSNFFDREGATIITLGIKPGITQLSCSDLPDAIITNESGSWSSEGVEIERLPSIVSSTSDGMDQAYQRVVLPSSSSYTVTCDPQEEIDLSLATEDGYYSVQGKGIDSILLSQEDGIKINGDQFDFTAGYLVDNGEEGILTRTEGAGSGTVSVGMAEGELSVSSENKMSLTGFTVAQNMEITRYDLDKESSHMTWDVNGGAPKTGSSVLLWLILSVAFAAIAVVILSLGTFLLVRYFRKKN